MNSPIDFNRTTGMLEAKHVLFSALLDFGLWWLKDTFLSMFQVFWYIAGHAVGRSPLAQDATIFNIKHILIMLDMWEWNSPMQRATPRAMHFNLSMWAWVRSGASPLHRDEFHSGCRAAIFAPSLSKLSQDGRTHLYSMEACHRHSGEILQTTQPLANMSHNHLWRMWHHEKHIHEGTEISLYGKQNVQRSP